MTDNDSQPPKVAQAEQLAALWAEIEILRQSIAAVAADTKNLATERAEVTVSRVEEALSRNVFLSVGLAALLGYIWGRTR